MKELKNIQKQIVLLYLIVSRSISRYYQRFFLKKDDHQFSRKNTPLKKYIVAALALIGFVLLAFRFGGFSGTRENVSEGIVGLYTGNVLPQSVANLISQPLVSTDKSGKPVPQLAASWQVNHDATVYTFKLKDNLYWEDGSKLKSSDIKFSLPDVTVSYPDDSTIEFKLADTFYPFPGLLTSPLFKDETLTGIGKYRVAYKETSRNIITKLILVPVDDKDGLPGVTIRFYPDEGTARTAFELGEVQSLVGMNGKNELSNEPGIKFKGVPNYNKLVSIFYNTKDSLLSDKNMRKALSYATPMIEGEVKAKTSLSPNSWAFNDTVKDMTNDPESAKSYLEKVSGLSGNVTLTTTPMLADLGEKIVASWKKNGISAVLRIESGVPQNFQALLNAESIPSDPDQYALWHSTQTKTNISKYDSNKRVDKDLEDGRKTGDVEKRKEKYLDLQKVLADDVPATFLYFPQNWVIYRPRIENLLNKVLPLQLLTLGL